MPFKSEAQRRYLWMKHPEIAERWTKKYGSGSRDLKNAAARKLKKNASSPPRRK